MTEAEDILKTIKANLERVETKLKITSITKDQEREENSLLLGKLLGKLRNEESINVEIRKQYCDLEEVFQKTKDNLKKHQEEVKLIKLIAKASEEKDRISHNKLIAEKKQHKKVQKRLKIKRNECREIKERLDGEKETWKKQEFKLETEINDWKKVYKQLSDEKQLEIEELKKKLAEKENTVFNLTKENSDFQENLTNQQAEITDLTTNLTNITTQKDLLQTEKEDWIIEKANLAKKISDLNVKSNKYQQDWKKEQALREAKEKEIIQELNNSLNLNLSEPTLSAIITHVKELITPSPVFSDDICIRDLEIIKKIDLIDMEKFLGIQLSAKEKQQFQATAINYQELVNFRHSFLKQNLAQISTITNKQSSKKENVLSVLLIMSLLIIGLQFIWMKKRTKRRVLTNT